jgi:hypothetical protein
MRSRLLLPALVFGLGLAGLAVIPLPAAAPPPNTKSVAQLVQQLSSAEYDDREAATEALESIGEPALVALRKAAESRDMEVRKRAGELVGKIEKQVERNRILAPRRVHLLYKNVPLPEAIADLRARSGYNVVLHDPTNKLRERKVTLDTGNVPFWEALDQFCAKANLIEGDPSSMPVAPPPPGFDLPPPPLPPVRRGGIRAVPAAPPVAVPVPALKKAEAPPAKPVKAARAAIAVPAVVVKEAVKKEAAVRVVLEAKPIAARAVAIPALAVPPGGGFAPAMPGPGVPPGVWNRPFVQAAPVQITLLDGKPKGEPTDARTAVRIRALTEDRRFGAARDREALLTLQISPEPKLQWRQLLGVKITRAIDDKGRALGEPVAAAPAPGTPTLEVGVPVRRGGVVGRTTYYNPYGASGLLHQYAPVRLARATPTKLLKELSGVVSAEVLSEPEPLIVAANVLKAKGKTFTGKQGGKFKIDTVEVRPGGQVIMQFEFEQPPGVIADNFSVQPWAVPAVMPAPAAVPAKAARGGRAVRGPAAALALKVVVVPGGAPGAPMMMPYQPNNGLGISLRDDKGNLLPVSVNMIFKGGLGGGVNRDYQLVYTPQKDHGKVTTLVFSGRRSVAVSIPFTLKDVKLP